MGKPLGDHAEKASKAKRSRPRGQQAPRHPPRGAIKARGLGDRRKPMTEDIAILTGAR